MRRRDRQPGRAEHATWVRPGTLVSLYAGRLRRQWLQELLAGAGIATGVMLVFAVLVANTSIKSSAKEIVDGIAGRAHATERDRRRRLRRALGGEGA